MTEATILIKTCLQEEEEVDWAAQKGLDSVSSFSVSVSAVKIKLL